MDSIQKIKTVSTGGGRSQNSLKLKALAWHVAELRRKGCGAKPVGKKRREMLKEKEKDYWRKRKRSLPSFFPFPCQVGGVLAKDRGLKKGQRGNKKKEGGVLKRQNRESPSGCGSGYRHNAIRANEEVRLPQGRKGGNWVRTEVDRLKTANHWGREN